MTNTPRSKRSRTALVAVLAASCGTADDRSLDRPSDPEQEVGSPTEQVVAPIEGDGPSGGGAVEPLAVDSGEVRASDATVLLTLADVPGTIRVQEGVEFGAADRFVDARASPDGKWLAVTTEGVAHSAGWLAVPDGGSVRPAAFQYGGSLEIGPWSEDGRQVVFIHAGPAGDHSLSVTDSENLGAIVDGNSTPVRVPDHDELPPEARSYEVIGWRGGTLHFTIAGEDWEYDPSSGDSRLRDP